MVKIYRKFEDFQTNRKSLLESDRIDSENKIDESVVEVGDMLKISNIEIKRSAVKSYINRVKQEKDQDLQSIMSIADIAEDMIKYSLENGVILDEIPTGALIGGDDEMESELDSEPIEVDADAEFAGGEEEVVGDVEVEDDAVELEEGDVSPEETETDEFEETEEGSDDLPI